MTDIRGFAAAAGRWDTAEPPYLPGGAQAGYERYEAGYAADLADDYSEHLSDVARGRTDEMTMDEFEADRGPMLTFAEWCETQEDRRR